ncbi:MAG: hypothetical protein M0024_10630 [Nitrospiraceae bacterium]|nr:hypothetical protein [Nitrospiraceae bacterium]
MVLALSLVLAGLAASAEPRVTITPKWSDLITESKECGGFSEDMLVLTIKRNGEEIVNEFCSSYGKADATIIKDNTGHDYLILKFAQGRGTNATSEFLSLYRIDNNFIEYVRIPISAAAGPMSRWYYDYRVEKPKQGGLLILLSRRLGGSDAEWYPKEKKRTIQIK